MTIDTPDAGTPRTDAAKKVHRYEVDDGHYEYQFSYVLPEDMAKLERELAALRTAHEAAQATIELLQKENGMQHTKLVAAQAKLATLLESHNNLRADYTKVRGECDGLREEAEQSHRAQAAEYKFCRERLMIRSEAAEAAEQRAADLQARLDRVEVDVMAFLETEYPMTRRSLQAAIRKVIRALASSPPAGGQTETAAAQSEQSVQAPSGGQPQESATAAAPFETDSEGWSKDPQHWANQEQPVCTCDMCGRKSWDKDAIFNHCAMIQPNGKLCPGQMLPSAASDAALPGLELAAKIC